VEVHDEVELERALMAGRRYRRHQQPRTCALLRSDLATTERLRPLVPPEVTVVAESGVHTRAMFSAWRLSACNGVLIGEATGACGRSGDQDFFFFPKKIPPFFLFGG